jgi:hypothetical protein
VFKKLEIENSQLTTELDLAVGLEGGWAYGYVDERKIVKAWY